MVGLAMSAKAGTDMIAAGGGRGGREQLEHEEMEWDVRWQRGDCCCDEAARGEGKSVAGLQLAALSQVTREISPGASPDWSLGAPCLSRLHPARIIAWPMLEAEVRHIWCRSRHNRYRRALRMYSRSLPPIQPSFQSRFHSKARRFITHHEQVTIKMSVHVRKTTSQFHQNRQVCHF